LTASTIIMMGKLRTLSSAKLSQRVLQKYEDGGTKTALYIQPHGRAVGGSRSWKCNKSGA
jgi:hypothetical protein